MEVEGEILDLTRPPDESSSHFPLDDCSLPSDSPPEDEENEMLWFSAPGDDADDCSLPTDEPSDDEQHEQYDLFDDEPSEPPPSDESDLDDDQNTLEEPPNGEEPIEADPLTPSDPHHRQSDIPLEASLSSNQKPSLQPNGLKASSGLQSFLASKFLKTAPPPHADSSIPPHVPPTISKEEKQTPSDEVMVPLQDHPEYSKFLKMAKVGLPLPAIREKIKREGYDPKYLDCSPETLIPLNKPSVVLNNLSNGTKVSSKQQQIKRRKIHWRAIREEDVDADMNIWMRTSPLPPHSSSGHKENGIEDMNELRKLFVLKLFPFPVSLSSLTHLS
jgi:hypothetical protein